MQFDIGPQYKKDDPFKASARLHQSHFRAEVLRVDFDEYGSRLIKKDGKALLNYYDGLNVWESLRKRYPKYSKNRDANMLRSEHIPFNLFSPLITNQTLALTIVEKVFHIRCKRITSIELEFAPKPIEKYLNDGTAFDVYIEYLNAENELYGIGIEVKYTELDYPLKDRERKSVEDQNSRYWELTRTSGLFNDPNASVLGSDPLRQIWRNHLLGLSMIEQGDINHFSSIILFPNGNEHFNNVIPKYRSLLMEKSQVRACTYEDFISAIEGNKETVKWKKYLIDRYIF